MKTFRRSTSHANRTSSLCSSAGTAYQFKFWAFMKKGNALKFPLSFPQTH